jgi:hypothetical protein
MSQKQPNIGPSDSCDDLKWTCSRCGLLLGYIDRATKRTVRIKMRENYMWVVDAASVSTVCKRCAAFQELRDEQKITASNT